MYIDFPQLFRTLGESRHHTHIGNLGQWFYHEGLFLILLADRHYRFQKIVLALNETVLVLVLANLIGSSTSTACG